MKQKCYKCDLVMTEYEEAGADGRFLVRVCPGCGYKVVVRKLPDIVPKKE